MKIRDINIEKPILLAPMEGLTDLPFRIVCKNQGADIVYTEFLASEAMIRNAEKTLKKMKIEDRERPVGVQIFGSKKESLVEAAKIVEATGADILDINWGCWVRKVVNSQSGAALLKEPDKMVEFTKAIVDAVKIPVTVKTRIGWNHDSIIIPELAPRLEDIGIEALTVHCRTRDMGMKGEADWSWIPKIKKNISIPLFLNGDVRTPQDAKRAFDETGCDGVMIGRAAVGDPFLFKQCRDYIDHGKLPQVPHIDERISVCLEHLQMNIVYKGVPTGIIQFRKHYTGYLKGFFMASRFRDRLVHTDTYEEVESILKEFRAFLKKEDRLIADPKLYPNAEPRSCDLEC